MKMDHDMEDCELRNQFGAPYLYTQRGAAVHSTIDQSVNKPLPYLCISMLIAGMAIAVSIWSAKTQDDKIRALETQVLLLREDVRQSSIESARQ